MLSVLEYVVEQQPHGLPSCVMQDSSTPELRTWLLSSNPGGQGELRLCEALRHRRRGSRALLDVILSHRHPFSSPVSSFPRLAFLVLATWRAGAQLPDLLTLVLFWAASTLRMPMPFLL